jgi:hypothetical protein
MRALWSMRWKAVAGLVMVGALLGFLPGRALAAFFSKSDSTANPFSSSRIFAGQHSISAWDVRDAADGSESDESDTRAFADARFTTTGNWASTWSASRYVEFEMNSPLAAGLALSDAAFSFRYADNDGAGGNQFCYYLDVRRTSTGAVLATYGSPGSPVSCETSQTLKTVSTNLPAVSTTDLANDVTIRLYGNHSGAKAARIDAAKITGSIYGNGFDLYPQRYVDASTGTGTTTRWGPALPGDGGNYQSFGNWSASFASNRYVKFIFPAYVPSGGVVTAASIEHSYKSATSGDTTCWYMEVYQGTTLLGTYGSAGSPISCNGTTSFRTDSVAIPVVDSPAKANNLVIRVYGRVTGSHRSQHDLVRLNLTYSLGA